VDPTHTLSAHHALREWTPPNPSVNPTAAHERVPPQRVRGPQRYLDQQLVGGCTQQGQRPHRPLRAAAAGAPARSWTCGPYQTPGCTAGCTGLCQALLRAAGRGQRQGHTEETLAQRPRNRASEPWARARSLSSQTRIQAYMHTHCHQRAQTGIDKNRALVFGMFGTWERRGRELTQRPSPQDSILGAPKVASSCLRMVSRLVASRALR